MAIRTLLANDMTARSVTHAIRGSLGAFLLGMCLVSIAVAVLGGVLGGWNAWLHPIHAGDKGFDRDVTWLEHASWSFAPSVLLGSIAGVITGVVVGVIRFFRWPKTDRNGD